LKRALIYSRVDKNDRAVTSALKAGAEALCADREWSFTHYTDSASGNRPPMQFAGPNQLIRPQLTRLMTALSDTTVTAIVFSAADALATNPALLTRLEAYLAEQGFTRENRDGGAVIYVRPA
jgi:DNA invertase Pin-like site-specific DNA recombinase